MGRYSYFMKKRTFLLLSVLMLEVLKVGVGGADVSGIGGAFSG